jgi:hypothetical protein
MVCESGRRKTFITAKILEKILLFKEMSTAVFNVITLTEHTKKIAETE